MLTRSARLLMRALINESYLILNMVYLLVLHYCYIFVRLRATPFL